MVIKEFDYAPTLGELISTFKGIIEEGFSDLQVIIEQYKHAEPVYPESIDSWRGSYNCLAIGYGTTNSKSMSVCNFIDLLKEQDGVLYEGYKGGLYNMSLNTEVYVDNYSCYTDRFISSVEIENEFCVIKLTDNS